MREICYIETAPGQFAPVPSRAERKRLAREAEIRQRRQEERLGVAFMIMVIAAAASAYAYAFFAMWRYL